MDYFLIHYFYPSWESEASPTLGCSIEISRDMCQFVCLRMPKCVGGITWSKNAHAQFWAVKNDLRHPCYSFLLNVYARAALALTKKKPKKKRSLKNEKLKAKKASETEEQRKERLRIRREKDTERRRTKKLQEEKIRSSETKDHEKQRLATLKNIEARG